MINKENPFDNAYQFNLSTESSLQASHILSMQSDDDFSEFDPEEMQRRRLERLKNKDRDKKRDDDVLPDAEGNIAEVENARNNKKKRATTPKKPRRDRPELWSNEEEEVEELDIPSRRREKRRGSDNWDEWQDWDVE